MDTSEKKICNFVDTSALLEDCHHFDNMDFMISPSTYVYLQKIAEDKNKRRSLRDSAINALCYLSNNSDRVIMPEITNGNYGDDVIHEFDVAHLALREFMNLVVRGNSDVRFVFYTSNWMSLKAFENYCILNSSAFIGDNKPFIFVVKRRIEPEYTGYKEVHLSEEEMANFYENLSENKYDLLTNQYLLIYGNDDEVVDAYRWDGQEHVPLKKENVKSSHFGTIKPYKGDVYQRCLFDSFAVNQITMVKGNAGTGKTACALGYLMYLLEKHKIDRIIVFTNTQPTLNTAKLGFYPGTRDSKLLTSSVGNILASKFGDSIAVERMIDDNKLMLVPMCDIRGFDTTGMNCGVLVTEAQNMDIYLMKLALQRIGEDSICIIDGDYNAQVDSEQYAGDNNGMRRLSQVFKGQDFYGEIELKNIYRSRIANVAERM